VEHKNICLPIQIVISYRAFTAVTTPVFLFFLPKNCQTANIKGKNTNSGSNKPGERAYQTGHDA
jgi:hypothetical protein